jgi:GAF domain-containing protein
MLEAQAPVPVGEASVLDEGWLFPMILFGRIVGALHCGQRAHDRIYEREDRAVLEELTRELAIAMVCLDPELNVRKLLAMTEEVATT